MARWSRTCWTRSSAHRSLERLARARARAPTPIPGRPTGTPRTRRRRASGIAPVSRAKWLCPQQRTIALRSLHRPFSAPCRDRGAAQSTRTATSASGLMPTYWCDPHRTVLVRERETESETAGVGEGTPSIRTSFAAATGCETEWLMLPIRGSPGGTQTAKWCSNATGALAL